MLYNYGLYSWCHSSAAVLIIQNDCSFLWNRLQKSLTTGMADELFMSTLTHRWWFIK